MENYTEREEDYVELLEVAQLLFIKAWKIILCFIIGAILAGSYTKVCITPQYSAKSVIYVLTKTTTVTSIADIQLSSKLTTDFQTLIKTRPSLETVIDNLGLDLTYDQLAGKIVINNPADTRFLEITVTDADPELARDIANELADVAIDRISYIMNTDKPKLVEGAIIPKRPSSPDLMRNALFGAVVGAILMVIWILIQYFMDDTLKTEDDVRKYLNLNVLAAIPINKKKKSKRKDS